jgi:mRNA interferase RelE/StbE
MDAATAKRIRAKILLLAQNPTAPSHNVKKLAGTDGFRLRVGDWRVIYSLRHRILTVIVIRVGHRSEIYQ